MTTVKELIDEVIKKEGGFADRPADKGGATKYGITQATLSNYYGKKCTVGDVKRMEKAVAYAIYELSYLTKTGINKLPEVLIPQVFDMAVNHGGSRAIKILQKTLNEFGYTCGRVDGFLGDLTISSAKKAVSDNFILINNAIVSHRIAFYESIVERDPSQKIFLVGWLARANSFHKK